MIEAIITGTLVGIISPLIVSFFQHQCIWRNQKKMEIKYSIFKDAISALSQYAVDATDPALQSNKQTYNNITRAVEARSETFTLMEKSRGMVKAFFSKETFEVFDKALNTPISIENVPNSTFEQARVEAIIKLATELKIK